MQFNKHSIFVGLYSVGAFSYVATNCYIDSKKKLNEYRTGKLDDWDKRIVKTEDDAVNKGMYDKIPLHIMFSYMWPIAFPITFIPKLVLKMNPPDVNQS
jgi:hypothetical protein